MGRSSRLEGLLLDRPCSVSVGARGCAHHQPVDHKKPPSAVYYLAYEGYVQTSEDECDEERIQFRLSHTERALRYSESCPATLFSLWYKDTACEIDQGCVHCLWYSVQASAPYSNVLTTTARYTLILVTRLTLLSELQRVHVFSSPSQVRVRMSRVQVKSESYWAGLESESESSRFRVRVRVRVRVQVFVVRVRNRVPSSGNFPALVHGIFRNTINNIIDLYNTLSSFYSLLIIYSK